MSLLQFQYERMLSSLANKRRSVLFSVSMFFTKVIMFDLTVHVRKIEICDWNKREQSAFYLMVRNIYSDSNFKETLVKINSSTVSPMKVSCSWCTVYELIVPKMCSRTKVLFVFKWMDDTHRHCICYFVKRRTGLYIWKAHC